MVPSLHEKYKGIKWEQWQILFSWAPKSLLMVTSAIILKTLAPWKESYDKPRQHIKKQRHQFANKSPYSQSYDFTSSHVQMWDLYHKEDWAPKNWCFWIVMLEKTIESLLVCKEMKPVSHKGIYPEYSLEGPILKRTLQYFGHLMWRANS